MSGALQQMMNNAGQMMGGIIGNGKYPMTEVKSSVDGKIYKVRDMPDKQQAADLIARVRLKMAKLYFHLEKTHPDKAQVKFLLKNFKPDSNRFYESKPDDEHTSYSVNKGEAVHFCIRQKEDGEKLVPENVMTFVAIHEMAHMITKTIGHDANFWNNFGWLLEQSEAIGIYQQTNFAAQPVAYCGVSITDQPKYDPKKDKEMFVGSQFGAQNFSIGTIGK